MLDRPASLVDVGSDRKYPARKVLLLIWPLTLSVFFFFDVVEHLRQMDVAID